VAGLKWDFRVLRSIELFLHQAVNELNELTGGAL
jgi:hypothetical protein